MDTPLLITFLGSPGSGKSFFARNLAERTGAVRLNGDSMRIALFESVEGIEAAKQENYERMNRQTFGAIDYAAGQVLSAGYSVVYDAHHNKRSIRMDMERLAADHGAVTIVVWVKTPYAVALRRGLERTATADQRRHTEESMKESTQRQMANFDEPVEGEKVIVIDGTQPFDYQLESYESQLALLLGK